MNIAEKYVLTVDEASLYFHITTHLPQSRSSPKRAEIILFNEKKIINQTFSWLKF